MTERLKEILQNIPTCDWFADVGCDHGYIAKAMLDCGKCRRVVISDVSAKCLEKAKKLLEAELADGSAQAVVSDGFKLIPTVDCALIAGMGGQEIIKILKAAPFLPQSLVLQPMKNQPSVREYVVGAGYRVLKDYTFYSGGEYYTLMVLEAGKDVLTDDEIEWGRTNLISRPAAFLRMLEEQTKKLRFIAASKDLSESTRKELIARAERMEKYL